MSQMVTTGCVSVEVSRIQYDVEVSSVGKNTTIKASIENLNGIAVSFVGKNKDLSCAAISANKQLNATFGIVCSVPSGFTVLYASDGALITIDNNYLIVQDNEE